MVTEKTGVTFETLIEELHGHPSGSGFVAHCPAHDDQHESLSINVKNEKVLLHCHAGCSQETVIEALKARDLWPVFLDEGSKNFSTRRPPHRSKKSNGKIVETYNYFNENEKLIYQVLRYFPKSFKQRRPDPDNPNNWIWNLEGIKPTLYRLPELIEAVKKGEMIFIPEGERDVKSLFSIGLTATCNPMGSGKWRDEFSKYFKNADVCILPDNDPLGLKHAQQIAESLFGTARSVKIIQLPGLKNKQDVTDWIMGGGTREKLLQIVDETEKWRSKDETEIEEDETKKQLKVKTKTLIPNLIHLVKDEDEIKYLIKENDDLVIKEFYSDGINLYRPKQDLPMKYLDPGILNEPEVNEKELLEEVITFIKSYLELPYQQQYLILALWVFHTYLIEKFDTTPILYFFGIKESGKTRAGEVLNSLAFKSERLTSPTESTLFRSADYFKTVLIIDEIKLWGPDGNKPVADLIKSRYKRGIKVNRINLNKKGEDQVEYFDVFGPLVICTTETIPETIESRCIVFTMQMNSNPEVERPIDLEKARALRNKLTMFRFKYFDKKLPDAKPIARRRLNEITYPLLQICNILNPEKVEEFKDYVKYLEVGKADEEGETTEAEIIRIIYNQRHYLDNYKFLTQSVSNRINESRSEKYKYSDRYISTCIKRLGFEKTRMNDGKMGFRYDEDLIKKLIAKYGIESS